MIILVFIVLGLISGCLGGLLGIGGGIVTVPALYFIFLQTSLIEHSEMQVAVATSLAAAIVTSTVATYFQYKKKAIHLNVVRLLFPGLLIGCVLGSIFSHYVSSHWLSRFFAIMMMFLGIYFSIPRLPHPSFSKAPNRSLSLFGFWIGSLSSALGIGGGSLTFPILLGYQLTVKEATANASGSTMVTTLFGTISYLIITWNKPSQPELFGSIYLPAFFWISLASLFSTPFGVKLSHKIDRIRIKRIFGLCLILISLSMFIGK